MKSNDSNGSKTPPKAPRKARAVVRGPEHVGDPPGMLLVSPEAVQSQLRVIRYDADVYSEQNELLGPQPGQVVWVDVIGLASLDLIRKVGEAFSLHPLALEDVTHTHERPKVEDYADTLFFVSQVAREHDGALDLEQVSLFVGDGFVVTFQEREGDAYEPVRRRLRAGRGRIRESGAGYLAYAIIDASIDAMFPLIEAYNGRIDDLEGRVFSNPSPALAEAIHHVGRDLARVRHAVLPIGESIGRLVRGDYPQVDEGVLLYFRDCQDHLRQMVDLLDGQRELVRSIADAHHATLGHRTNEVMKVLTMTATLFIPLSFIAGLYGMNFDRGASPFNMPELEWRYGYPFALLLMAVSVTTMFVVFRRKRWL